MPIIIPDYLPYTPRGIECLRFGARRGGEGIGCCAVDVLQGFSNPPDAVRPNTPFYDGDSWIHIEHYDGDQSGPLYLAGTNEEVFLSYLVHGSFTNEPVADHAFIAVISEEQCNSDAGRAWLRILKREGFKYIDTVNNGVYAEYHPNHIFMLVRNTDEHISAAERETLGPPSFWGTLEEPEKTPEQLYHERQYTIGSCFSFDAE